MAGDAPAPASGAPPIDYNAIIQQIMQGGGGISGPAAPATPAVNTNLPVASLLGEALGGGVSPLYPMSEAQQTQAGNAALLNFGINMLQNSGGPVRHSLGQAVASGLLGAQGSLAGVREGQAQMLDVQNKQQTMQIERLKAVLPLLQLQQFGAARDLALGNKPAGTGLAATGAPIATGSGVAPADMVGSIASTLNIPTADAAAIASNFHAESGLVPGINEIKPAPGTRGGYGLAQWTDTQGSPRRTDLEAYATANKLNVADPATQLAFMKQEIQQKYPNLLPQMAAAKTPEEKAAIFYNTYEGGPPRLLGAHTAMAAPFAALPPPGSAPGGSKTATAPPAPTTPPAASTAPPGVQMGGAVPPPPGGAPGAAATPYQAAGAGIGRVLTDTTGKVGPQQVTVAPPPPNAVPIGKGTPIPTGKLLPKVADNVAAIQAGMQLGQTAPAVTALTAGPGAPTATATAAPAAPQPGWGSTVGTYGLPGQKPPATPATVTPPPQPSQPATAPLTPPQPPGPARVPDTFTATRVPLPADIQHRIDSPEIPPEYDTALHTALTPEALQAAQNSKAAAIVAAKKEAIAQGEAFQAKAADQQQEQWKVLRAEQQANDSAAATRQQEQDMEILRNSEAQTNQLRNAQTTADQGQLKTYQAGSDAAQQQINTIQILRNVEKNMPDSGSVILQRHPELLDTLTNMGLPKAQADAMSATDLFQRMLGFLGTQLSQKAAVGAGTARQAEIAQNMSVLPGLATDHNGRQQLMGFLLNLAQYQVNKANAAEDYYNTNTHPRFKDLPSLFGFERKYGDNPDNAIIPQVPLKPDGTPDQGWASSHVKPGMLFKAPVLQRDPGGKPIFSQDGKPVYRPQTLVQGDAP